jgi:Periplasmic copper-binding protein (NosD)
MSAKAFLIGRCAILISIFVISLSGATYYVDSVGGNDSNTGTLAPWRTISKVNAHTFGPGDQILFKRGGVWHDVLVLTSSGSAAHPITVGAYGTGAAPVLDQQGVRWPVVKLIKASHIVLRDLAMENASNVTVYLSDSSNITVLTCALKNSKSHAIYVTGMSPNAVIANNTYSMDPGFVMSGAFIHVLSAVESFTARGNTVVLNDNATTNGIYILDVDNAHIFGNTIYNGTEAIGVKGYTRSVYGAEIYDNAAYNASHVHGDGESIEVSGYYHTGGNSAGLQAQAAIHHNFVVGGPHTMNAIAGYYASHSTVYNNIVVGPALDAGIHFSSYSSDVSVYGNDIYNVPYGVMISTQSQAVIMNNIITGAVMRAIAAGGDGGSAKQDYNIFYRSGASAGVAGGLHSVTANPKFISASPSKPADFQLQGGSPAIGSGASLDSAFQMALNPAAPCFPCRTISQDSLGPWTRGAFAFMGAP